MGGMEMYEKDFEESLLSESAAFYKRKASERIESDSCPGYMIMAEECLKQEEERVENYLHASTKVGGRGGGGACGERAAHVASSAARGDARVRYSCAPLLADRLWHRG